MGMKKRGLRGRGEGMQMKNRRKKYNLIIRQKKIMERNLSKKDERKRKRNKRQIRKKKIVLNTIKIYIK